MRVPRFIRWFVPTRRQAVGLLVGYFALILLIMFGGCADRIILFPSTQPIPAPGIARVEVPARGGGQPVEVWTARSPGARGDVEPQAYCLEFTGNATRGEQMAGFTADEWGTRPVEVWSVNYPGYGGSPGPARLKSIPPAALATYDALAAKANGKPIFLIGQSLGSAAALHVAANRPCAGMVLTNPPPLRDMILKRFGWWNLWLLATPVAMSVPGEMDSIANAKRTTAPAIFILAQKDSVVPPKYQAKVFDAYAGEKRAIRVPDADHNDPLDGPSEQAFDEALDWMWKHVVGDSGSLSRVLGGEG
jgi:pimeloyl-ACP methyl ester carboxylesterase